MPFAPPISRPFEPGTTGWTAADLDEPSTSARWAAGSFEIVEGVLTTMPPAYFIGGQYLVNLLYAIKSHLKQRQQGGYFATEVEIILSETRVARSDAAFLTPEDKTRQDAAAREAGRADPRRARILIPPTLIIESVSPGHELHDTRIKKAWYAEFGVPHYWIIDAFEKSLDCLVLAGSRYETAASGRGDQTVVLPPFGVSLNLKEVWEG